MLSVRKSARTGFALGLLLTATGAWAAGSTDVALTSAGGADPAPAGTAVPPGAPAAYLSSGYRSMHYVTSVSGFSFPFQITTDGDTFFVSDATANVVKLYQIVAGGVSFVRDFGSGSGAGPGQFNGPEQVAVVGNDVYVADFSNNRIQRFNKSTGAYVSQFGVTGSGAGQLNSPSGLVYNPGNGLLYVGEVGNDRISTFTTSGTYQFQFGSPGSGNGQLNNPFVLGIDVRGNIYAADSNNNRSVKFDPSGVFLRNIGVGVTSPLGLAVGAEDLVTLTASNGDSYSYDVRGNYVSYYYGALASGTAVGYLSNPRGVGMSAPLPFAPYNGTPAIIVADAGSPNVQIFNRSLQAIAHPPIDSLAGLSGFIGGVAFDSAENVYVTSLTSNVVRKYDKFGNFLLQWGGTGSGNGQFSGPYGICVDDSNNVYVADNINNRIQKFDSSGTYVTQWGSSGSANGQFAGPGGLATDGSWIYVSDEGNQRVQKFSLAGSYVRQWGSAGSGNGQFSNPAGIAVDRTRNQVYVAEYFGNRIQQFSVFGDFIKVLSDSTSGTGALSNPVGLTTDQHGNLYAADRGNNRVVQYNDNGTYLANFAQASANAVGLNPRNAQMYVGASSGGTVAHFGSVTAKADLIGLYRPSTRTFRLRPSNSAGPPSIVATVTGALASDVPLTGDWNGDGIDTAGLYRPSTSTFYLWDRWSNLDMANATYIVAFGAVGDRPIAGDWDGDGKDSLGVYRPSTGVVYLRNALTGGTPDYSVTYGQAADTPLAGDWNLDGAFSAGMYRNSDRSFHVSNRNVTATVADDGVYALGNAGDLPVVGDWTHAGYSGIGAYRPSTGTFLLKYNLDASPVDLTTSFDGDLVFRDGFDPAGSGDVPLAGFWGTAPE